MGFHGGGWFGYLGASDQKPKVTWQLLRRVLTYGRPYRGRLVAILFLILSATGLGLLNPLILRDLIDRTIPSGMSTAWYGWPWRLLSIPVANGAIAVLQRRFNSQVGEGV